MLKVRTITKINWRVCTWEELSVGFILTSNGSFFTSAADLMVLVFWSKKKNPHKIIMFWYSWTERVSERQREADDLPARLLVSPAAVWFCLPVLSVCLQMSACLSSEHHMANSVSAQEHHTWTHNILHQLLVVNVVIYSIAQLTTSKTFPIEHCSVLPVLLAVWVHETHPTVRVAFVHSIHLERQRSPL